MAVTPQSELHGQRPNILLFIPHDLGDTLHCYDHSSVRSPSLDGLASRGVRFTNCFTTCPECTSSRGSLMTGLMPHQNGLLGLAHFGWKLRVPHLAERLARSGYATHLFGFQHETDADPRTLGYAHVHAQDDRNAGPVCDAVCDFLDRGAGEPGGEPWFAYAGFRHVHRPWADATEFSGGDVDPLPYLPDNETIRNDLADFHQSIFDMDRAVGRVLDALRHHPAAGNTLVIFTTDHGAAFPRAKATLYDPGIRVSLLMHWPGHVEGGRVCRELISNMDMTPTLLDIAGIPPPPALEGRTFLPLLSGDDYAPRQEVEGALFYDVAYDPMHYVRTNRYKYIRSFAVTDTDAKGADPNVLSTFIAGPLVRCNDWDVLGSPSWQSIRKAMPLPAPEELYDLRQDPLEQHNLANSSLYRQVLDSLRDNMQAMMRRTDSPLLNGHAELPACQRTRALEFRRRLLELYPQ